MDKSDNERKAMEAKLLLLEKQGQRLHHWRTKAGLSQDKLGELVGVSKTAIQKWENGKADIGVGYRKRLVEILKINLGQLAAFETSEYINAKYLKAEPEHKKLVDDIANRLLELNLDQAKKMYQIITTILSTQNFSGSAKPA